MPELILLFNILSDYIVKVINLINDILEAGNPWLANYYINYINKLEIKKSTYNFCLFYSFGLFCIVKMRTNDTLILANNNFAYKEKAAIKSTKILTKN